MNMKKVKLADLFKQYGVHYLVTYQASIEKGIIFQIEKKIGHKQNDDSNSFMYESDIFTKFKPILEYDYKNLVEYHTEELNHLSKGHFLSTLINKDKKEKIAHHQLRLRELDIVYTASDRSRCITDENNIFNMFDSEIVAYDYLNIIDLTNPEQMAVERIYVNSVVPFIDSENNISIKLGIVSFNVTKIELMNPVFNNNHIEPIKGYHIFNCREKAHDFSTEELMKSQYNKDIKTRLKLAKQVDNLFGSYAVY